MLKHLTIQNYALIRQLEMMPAKGLNVITGETGAGKSIMLGAIGLLMGNRADTKVLWSENDKCITEGTFEIGEYKLQKLFKQEDLDYDDQTVIRREISPQGKSRAFINDSPVTLDVLRKIGSRLMDIHSQHETLLLGNQEFQLNLIDLFAANEKILTHYSELWRVFQTAKKNLEEITSQAESLRQESDYIQFQLDELVKMNLVENEQEQLETELKVMEHAEDIKSKFHLVLESISRSEFASRTSLGEAKNNLYTISPFSVAYENLYHRMESLVIELDDIVNEIENAEEKVEFDPQRTEYNKERLSAIYRLHKKHRVNTLAELLTIQDELQRKADITSNLDEALTNAKNAFESAEKNLLDQAVKLTTSRKKIFTKLTAELEGLLKEVGIPEAKLDIVHTSIQATSTGCDAIDILFSANKGIAPKPLAQVASGGEFSRVMFCLKYVLADKTSMPTLILDEIDNGVSGEIALKLGKLMQQMSERHQLITITHLPQIASKGNAHYFVFKDNSEAKTISNIRLLKKEERIHEIAQMIGGASPSKVALQSAKELLSLSS